MRISGALLTVTLTLGLAACGGGSSEDVGGDSGEPDYSFGDEGVVATRPDEDAGIKEGLTIRGVECTTKLADSRGGTMNLDTGDTEYMTSVAQFGNKWCVVEGEIRAAGDAPVDGGYTQFGELITASGTEYSGESASEQSSVLTTRAGTDEFGTVNPGQSVTVFAVYEIPEDEEPSAVRWGAELYSDEPGPLFDLQ